MRLFLLCLIFVQFAHAGVLSQWRGLQRNGHYSDNFLLQTWPEGGPEKLWHVDNLGKGFTSAAVTSDRIYITGVFGDEGWLFAFNHDGKLLFRKSYGPEWTRNYAGTRSTPVVVDDLIYLESGQGVVYCLRALDGSQVWAVDLLKKFHSRNIDWGMTEQLLVDGDRIYCTPGGPRVGMVALDRLTGKTIWTSPGNGELSSYCSPILVNHNGIRMLITMLQKSVIGVNAETGELLWRRSFPAPYDIHANMPIYHDGGVYVQAGEGGIGMVLKIAADGKSVAVLWENDNMDTLTGHAVLIDGFIYGAGYPRKGFQALDWNTGVSQFEARDFTRSNVIVAAGRIYVYTEKGVVGLVKPNPKKFELLSSFRIREGSGPHWAHVVIHDGRMYIRHGDVLMVYDIREK